MPTQNNPKSQHQKFDSDMGIVSLKVYVVKIKLRQSQELFGVPLFHCNIFFLAAICNVNRDAVKRDGPWKAALFIFRVPLMAGFVSNTILP